MLSLNIIGAGRLGTTLGYLFHTQGLLDVVGVHNRSEASSRQAIDFIGAGTYKALIPADITLIATPDDAIEEACAFLCRSNAIKPGAIVFHCSGSRTSDSLAEVKLHGAYTASIHPMKSFADPNLSILNFNGTYCAIEGDEDALQLLEPLFREIGAITYKVRKEQKALYHAAGVFASNYLVTLYDQAMECMTRAGVDDAMAASVMIHLMKGTLANLETSRSAKTSLTGPLKRGDVATIQSHLKSMETPQQKALYAQLAQASFHLTDHPQQLLSLLQAALRS